MIKSENKKELQELIELTSDHLGLSQPFVVEKDYYVTQVLHLLSKAENPYFQLIFQGGTCLAKAHHVIQRMSEDCDFRIEPTQLANQLSKQQFRNYLRDFRYSLIEVLGNGDFDVKQDLIKVGDGGNFMRVLLPYSSHYQKNNMLRSEILLEFINIRSKTPTKKLPITTLIKHTLGNQVQHAETLISCISIIETAAEKWVALTRRIASSL